MSKSILLSVEDADRVSRVLGILEASASAREHTHLETHVVAELKLRLQNAMSTPLNVDVLADLMAMFAKDPYALPEGFRELFTKLV